MKFIFILIVSSVFTSVVLATEYSMPPQKPKAQVAQPPAPNESGEYGEAKIKLSDLKSLEEASTEGEVTIKTTVTEVCPKKGCWMSVKGPKKSPEVRVTFKDYGFFVPTELVGKEIALKGQFIKHVESVEEQKHLLKDAKKSQAEIDAVTQPKETIRFVATGVKDLTIQPKK